jgi:hypothetical protein
MGVRGHGGHHRSLSTIPAAGGLELTKWNQMVNSHFGTAKCRSAQRSPMHRRKREHCAVQMLTGFRLNARRVAVILLGVSRSQQPGQDLHSAAGAGAVASERAGYRAVALWLRQSARPVERLIGTLRRDCLDHVLIERHLRRVLTSYSLYYNETRTHLGWDAPLRRAVQRSGTIIITPNLSGLHHRYARI